MATIINNPDGGSGGGSGVGTVVGLIVLVLIVILFLIYGLPAIRGTNRENNTTIQVPDKVQVDVDSTNQ